MWSLQPKGVSDRRALRWNALFACTPLVYLVVMKARKCSGMAEAGCGSFGG